MSAVRHLPAAVISETDPRSRDLARAVPADAKLQKIGAIVTGYSVHPRKRRRDPVWLLNAKSRRRELNMVCLYKQHQGLAMGPAGGWAFVVGNLCRVLYDSVTAESLQEEAVKIGRGRLDGSAVDAAVQEIMGKAWGRYRLYSGDQVGSLIELSSVERQECGVEKIAAMDEPTPVRRRRENRERMQRKRAASAALRPISKAELARRLGLHIRTVHRMIKRGEIVRVTESVHTSIDSPPSKEDPCTQTVTPGRAHANSDTPLGPQFEDEAR
ncbi:MAG: hypothetical protein EOP19_10460 [Hyphomicrobiales bacterium]|nr:MAG: hypothetical protein EOP19_10460 [Hyphomicrobiales bacterium]